MFCPVGFLLKNSFRVLESPLWGRLSSYFKSNSMILITKSFAMSAVVRTTIIFWNFVINITSSGERRKPTISHALTAAIISQAAYLGQFFLRQIICCAF